MIDLVCSYLNSEILCQIIKDSPRIITYFLVGLLAIYGIFNLLVNTIPNIEIFKSKIYLPLVKKRAFKRLTKQAIKADIRGNVNSAVLKLKNEFPSGWLKPMEIEWVQYGDRKDFLNDNEIVIRIRPLEDQKINFINALYCFLKKSFFPKNKKVIPESYLEASVLFTSNKILKNQKPELIDLFNDYVLEPEVDKNEKILRILERYNKIDERGFFSGTFIREVHAVASEVKLTSLRNKMRQEVNEIIKHIEDFIKHYDEGLKQSKWRNTIPAEMWSRLGPVTNYGFLLIAMPIKASQGSKAIQGFVNRAKKDLKINVKRLYVFGTDSEKHFAKRVIHTISREVPEYKLIEEFNLSNDYRGNPGGIGALFVKK